MMGTTTAESPIDARVSAVERRLAELERRFQAMERRLSRVDRPGAASAGEASGTSSSSAEIDSDRDPFRPARVADPAEGVTIEAAPKNVDRPVPKR